MPGRTISTIARSAMPPTKPVKVVLWGMTFQVTPSRILLAFCFGALAGAFFFSGSTAPQWVSAGLLIGGVACIAFGFPFRASFGSVKYFPAMIGFALLGTVLGIARTEHFLTGLSQETILGASGTEVTLVGAVSRYPDVRIEGARFVLDVSLLNGELVEGRVLVFAGREAAVSYGDMVSVRGKVEAPKRFRDFNYPAYLAKDHIVATVAAKEITAVGAGGNLFGRIAATSRSAIEQTALSVLPFQEGAMLKALLLGDEGSMTEDVKTSLNRSGLRHIVAVSGMNITIIVSLLAGGALRLGLWRRQAFFAATAGIIAFIVLIGFPASAVRAAIMGVMLRMAPILGRRNSGFRPAVFAATAMVFLSPLTLRYDIGFQLSFLAVIGIIFLAPWFAERFQRLPWIFREAFSMTLAAQLAVTPLLLSVFGQVSLVSPFTNLLVVPLLSLATVWGFLSVFLGMAWLPLGAVAALPLLPYFFFIGWIADFSSTLPWATVGLPFFSLAVFAAAWYAVLAWFAWRIMKSQPRPVDLLASHRA